MAQSTYLYALVASFLLAFVDGCDQACRDKFFLAIDKSGNSAISILELVVYFQRFDPNGDGKITKDESNRLVPTEEPTLVGCVDSIIKMLDIDGNGSVELIEGIKHFIKAKKKIITPEVSKAEYDKYFNKICNHSPTTVPPP